MILQIQKAIDYNSSGNIVWNNGMVDGENEVESIVWKEAVEVPLLGIAI